MSNEEIRRHLEHFFDYFRARLGSAQKGIDGKIEGYILSLTALDALAFYATGKQGGAHTFQEFIYRYSGFREIYNRVSVPLLVQQLRLRKPKSCKPIADWAYQEFDLSDHYVGSRIRGFEEDPEWDTFWERLRAANLRMPKGINHLLKKFIYAQVLYLMYRNDAVHRQTIREEAPNIAGEKVPYYMNEHASFVRFDCGRIGFHCWITSLALYSGVENLQPSTVAGEIQRALADQELDAPVGMVLDPSPRWDETFSMWQGELEVDGKKYEWALSEMYELHWMNFGIPRVFILQTLGNAITNLERACQVEDNLAAIVCLNYQKRFLEGTVL